MTPEQLKASILQYAMQGKLVPQNPEDEPASVLLEKIKAEKEQLIAEGKIKKEKALPEITEEEKPFDIPENWEWVRIGDLFQIKGGKRVPKGMSLIDEPTEHVYIRVTDMKNGTIDPSKIKYLPDDVYEKIKNYYVESNDLYITIAGTIGKIGKIPIEFNGSLLTENAVKLQNMFEINNDYLVYALQSEVVQTGFMSLVNKVAQPKLSIRSINSTLFPLPPLEEQQRIVEKIEELLPLIDQYGEAYKELEQLNAEFPKKMEQSLLQHAMEGKLVPQIASEEPASQLLKRIKAEKEHLIAEGKIKKEKALPAITEEEKPFDIPESWEWVRISEVTYITMGQAPKGDKVNEIAEGIEFHQGKSFFCEKYIGKSEKYTTEINKIVGPDTVVMSVRAPVGNVNLTNREIYIGRGLADIKPSIGVDLHYLYYLLITKKSYLDSKSTGSTFKAITGDVLKSMVIPIPPLEEQKRIVAAIEEGLSIIKSSLSNRTDESK
ncbi:restriction endonuclease subunit S [Vagococcus lutrae]|uniref:restriction endonuclease subunit S n=1 Tax=Vagococcus lutrae TaxID=81947 RepID=UPI00200F57DF|nr:restriction endonuclease subunit S [Vagococcus lutrae]UQF71799.1 restriction endonuclease subunit S [Vagococcus lutrae]